MKYVFNIMGNLVHCTCTKEVIELLNARFKGIEQESIKSATLNLRPYKLQNTE